LNERLGRYAFWFWFIGFLVAFMPLYVLGLMGATRRLDHYDLSTGWHPFFIVVAFGAALIVIGIIFQNIQLFVSIMQREKNRDISGDPWNGRTLEWSTPSPPPIYNFALIPTVSQRDSFWATKETIPSEKPQYQDIELPKNTPAGLFIAGFAFLFGFGIIWHMWWLGVVGVIGIIICLIIQTSRKETEFVIPAEEVARIEASTRVQDI
jgi:cytochrome o ubiquinol oxidase subunit 1